MKKKKFTEFAKKLIISLSLIILGGTIMAQSPAANISGPLLTKAGTANITVLSKIAYGSTNPTLNYTLENNTSGATIVSQGSYSYDFDTEIGNHSIIINPGDTDGSFTIKLEVQTNNGIGTCSKSVVVTKKSD